MDERHQLTSSTHRGSFIMLRSYDGPLVNAHRVRNLGAEVHDGLGPIRPLVGTQFHCFAIP